MCMDKHAAGAHVHCCTSVRITCCICSWPLLQVRLLALLREPVGRALSSVNMIFQRSAAYSHLKMNTPEYEVAWRQYVTSQLQKYELLICSTAAAKVHTL